MHILCITLYINSRISYFKYLECLLGKQRPYHGTMLQNCSNCNLKIEFEYFYFILLPICSLCSKTFCCFFQKQIPDYPRRCFSLLYFLSTINQFAYSSLFGPTFTSWSICLSSPATASLPPCLTMFHLESGETTVVSTV